MDALGAIILAAFIFGIISTLLQGDSPCTTKPKQSINETKDDGMAWIYSAESYDD